MSHTSALGRGGSLTSKLACDIAVLEEQSDLGPLCLLQRCLKRTNRRNIVTINNRRAI